MSHGANLPVSRYLFSRIVSQNHLLPPLLSHPYHQLDRIVREQPSSSIVLRGGSRGLRGRYEVGSRTVSSSAFLDTTVLLIIPLHSILLWMRVGGLLSCVASRFQSFICTNQDFATGARKHSSKGTKSTDNALDCSCIMQESERPSLGELPLLQSNVSHRTPVQTCRLLQTMQAASLCPVGGIH